MLMSVDLAHKILPTKNQRREVMRFTLRPKISENVPHKGCVIVDANKNPVPLQKAWFDDPPRSDAIAGRAAAMMTASSAEMNAVRTNVVNAVQNLPDFPAQKFAFRGFLSRESGVGGEDASSSFISNWLGE